MIEIRVELEYLPKVSETLLLPRAGQKAQAAMGASEVQAEVGKISQLMSQMGKSNFETGTLNTGNIQGQPVWERELEKGAYMVGVLMAANYYDDGMCEDYDHGGS